MRGFYVSKPICAPSEATLLIPPPPPDMQFSMVISANANDILDCIFAAVSEPQKVMHLTIRLIGDGRKRGSDTLRHFATKLGANAGYRLHESTSLKDERGNLSSGRLMRGLWQSATIFSHQAIKR